MDDTGTQEHRTTRILVLHALVGMGHYRAATALAQAFGQVEGTLVQVEDTLCYSHALFRRAYAGSYLGIADHVPSLWSRFYRQTDQPASAQFLVAGVRALSTTLGVRGLSALVAQAQPDAIVATHFLPLEVLGPLRQRGLLPPLYCVVTDYRAHHFWVCDGVDGYFAPTPATAAQLIDAGVRRSQVHVTGIPIDPAISLPIDQATARRALNLPTQQPVVLLNGSGIATRRVRAIAVELINRRMPGTLLIAAGRNRELVAALADLQGTAHTRLHVLGQQPSLDPLIAASELVIGKGGGLTVSEVLGRGVPLIVPTPVPGQEQANAEFVVESGAGLCCETAQSVAEAVNALLHDGARRAAMAAAARAAGRPAAATLIAGRVLADVHRGYRPARLRPAALSLAAM